MVYTVHCIFSSVLDAFLAGLHRPEITHFSILHLVKNGCFLAELHFTRYAHFSILHLVKNGCFLAELQICYAAYSRVPIPPEKKGYTPYPSKIRHGAPPATRHPPPAAAEEGTPSAPTSQPYMRMTHTRHAATCITILW